MEKIIHLLEHFNLEVCASYLQKLWSSGSVHTYPQKIKSNLPSCLQFPDLIFQQMELEVGHCTQ